MIIVGLSVWVLHKGTGAGARGGMRATEAVGLVGLPHVIGRLNQSRLTGFEKCLEAVGPVRHLA